MSDLFRIRTFDERVPTRRHYRWTGGWDPYSGGDDGYTGENTGKLTVVHDVNNKEFRKLQKSGAVVMSDCTITKWSRSFASASIRSDTEGWYHGSISGDQISTLAGLPQMPNPQVSGLEDSNQMLIKAYAKMNSAAILSGEILSDLGETVSMIRRPFKGASELLTKILSSKNRRLRRGARSAAKASADAWLEYRYGWKPLIMDCDTIMKECASQRAKCDLRRLVARAGGSGSAELTNTVVGTAPGSTSGSCSAKLIQRRNVGVVYDLLSQTPSEAIAQFYGLNASSLPSTIWEVVPYSFVVDWFVNVGDWLQAITPNPGIQVRGHWCTTVSEFTTKRSGSVSQPQTAAWWGDYGGDEVTAFTYNRVCNQQIAFTPSLKAKPLSILHQADAAALLLQPIMGALSGCRH